MASEPWFWAEPDVSGAQLQNLPVSGHSQDHWQSKTLEVVADDLVVAAAAVAALRLTGCHSDHGNGLHRSQAECKFHVT
ncbi:unnamed protein product [Effrenium voratum]|uniref:Uncharacterized protein n=1 Tax=Effrenium voratum TaxID=2562239 RepID=A0AA36HWW5_9DINO|nr:unnamed protein product [Effrenium voratum]CAJ1376812.1 unnamed protein product [Effrenium voratum]